MGCGHVDAWDSEGADVGCCGIGDPLGAAGAAGAEVIPTCDRPDALCSVCGEPAVMGRGDGFGRGCRAHGVRDVQVFPERKVVASVRVPFEARRFRPRRPSCRVCGREAISSRGLCAREAQRARILGLPNTASAEALTAAWAAHMAWRRG